MNARRQCTTSNGGSQGDRLETRPPRADHLIWPLAGSRLLEVVGSELRLQARGQCDICCRSTSDRHGRRDVLTGRTRGLGPVLVAEVPA
jgi:hypothetical protein